MTMTWQEEWLASLNTVWVEPPKPKRKPIEAWVNAYAENWGRFYETQEEAKLNADVGLIKTVRLVEATEAKEIWRLLEVGEIVQAGDEYQVGLLTWQPTSVPRTVVQQPSYRRRVKVVEVVE